MSSIVAEIFEGWKNFAFKNPHIEKIAEERATHCIGCKIKGKAIMKNKMCTICGCYVPAKVRSLNSKCPLNKW